MTAAVSASSARASAGSPLTEMLAAAAAFTATLLVSAKIVPPTSLTLAVCAAARVKASETTRTPCANEPSAGSRSVESLEEACATPA